jgi:hypothetical protein
MQSWSAFFIGAALAPLPKQYKEENVWLVLCSGAVIFVETLSVKVLAKVAYLPCVRFCFFSLMALS